MILVERTEADVRELQRLTFIPTPDRNSWKGIVVTKPWGHEEELHRGGALSVWRLHLKQGAETSMHCHPNKRTALMVESGHCILETLDSIYPLKPGDMVHIEMGAFHRTRTNGGCVLLEIETPANKTDLARLNDRYGRAGKAYECA